MAKPFHVGVCGTGYWAEMVHLPTLLSTEDVVLGGLFRRSVSRGRELSERFQTAYFPDFDELLENKDAISFVVPPDVQVDLALRAVECGKHVLLEKPIATSQQKADVLVEAIEKKA